MCGIYGYVGEPTNLASDILCALKTLEYRGYDSWGVALGVNGHLEVRKSAGKIGDATLSLPTSGIGFGHTRWATHGGVTDANAHPHLDCTGRFAVIHNGIVENFRSLRAELELQGHHFRSETDSEVIAHLLEERSKQEGRISPATFGQVIDRLQGLSAIIAIDNETRTMFAAKNVSPLVLGAGPDGSTIASDAIALHGKAELIHHLEDGQVAEIHGGSVRLWDLASMREIAPTWRKLPDRSFDTGLAGHPDFMSKEMAEQPDVLERLARTANGEISAMAHAIQESYGTFLVGCGTASYAALTGSYLFSRIAKRHVNFVVGSEFKYHEHFLTNRSLVIALSQSGETADIIEAMLAARARGARLGAILNAEQSTLDRMVDLCIPLRAGPEQCVLSTKAYTAKVATLIMLAHEVAGQPDLGRKLVLDAASALRSLLTRAWIGRIQAIAEMTRAATSMFIIGRGLSYPTALEAALKIKEVSYIHAEGFAGGELKHGVIALVEPGTPCIVYAPEDESRRDIISGAMELKARRGFIVGIGSRNDPAFDVFVEVPDVGDAAPLVQALPAQMLGYHSALIRGNDPDKPRNLAKSVTVK
ncbi:MAG: glutamine--fructose-6-phosphate transaminase (isomerizing) [Thermomicrobiales bacterium]|nr:glutamine--fructose-6-phosphate transaminase (isomerizing) [Thermomicrobiales bacterium]